MAIVNKAAMNISVQIYLFEWLLFSLFWYMPGSGIASAGVLNCFSHVWLLVTVWMAAHQDPLSMGFCRQGYWSELPCPPPGDLPNPGTEPISPALQMDSLPLSHLGSQQMCRDQTIVLCSLLIFISLWLTPHMYYLWNFEKGGSKKILLKYSWNSEQWIWKEVWEGKGTQLLVFSFEGVWPNFMVT